MTDNNVAELEAAEKKFLDEEEQLPELTDADLLIPTPYLLELQANEVIEHRKNVYVARMQVAANHSVNNDSEELRWSKIKGSSERTLQLLKRDSPKSFVLADELSVFMARQAADNRKQRRS